MIVIESGDLIEGDATNATEVDFQIYGLDNNALVNFADGQLPNSKGTLYTANSTDVVTAIILVNTGAAHNHINLYHKPSAGTSRRLIAKDLQLESGYSLHFEGGKCEILTSAGVVAQTVDTASFLDDTAGGTDGLLTKAPTSNVLYDHTQAADPHAGYVLESLFDAQTILQATSNNTPAALTVGEQTVVGRITSGNIAALTVAELQALLFSAALPENVTIQLDASISTDEKFSGMSELGTFGETIQKGELLYLASSGKWLKAKADSATTSTNKLGIALADGIDTGTGQILLIGKMWIQVPDASVDYMHITNCSVTPATTWYAGTHSTDNGGNSGWIFTAP
jgi:hypothetical protein